MKAKSSKKKTHYLVRLFLSYSIILLIPFLLVFFTYQRASNVIIQQANTKVKDSLSQTRDITDANLRAMETIALALKEDENITSFYKSWIHQNETVYSAYKINRSLPYYQIVNSLVDHIVLFFGKQDSSDCFVIKNGNAMKYNDYLMRLSFENTSLTYEEVNQYLFSNNFYNDFRMFSSDQISQPTAYFLSDIPSYRSDGYCGTIMIQLSNSFFSEMLSNAMVNNQGAAFIMTENREIITLVNGSPDLINSEFTNELVETLPDTETDSFLYRNMQVNVLRSNYNGWSFCSVIPNSVVLAELTVARSMIIIAAVITLILGFFICSIISMRHSRPVVSILDLLIPAVNTTTFDSLNDFKFIETAISELIRQNHALARQDHTRSHLYDLAILNKLFLNDEINTETFQHELIHSSIRIEDCTLAVIYLHIHGVSGNAIDYDDISLSALFQALEIHCNGSAYAYPIDKNNYVILWSESNSGDKSTIVAKLKNSLQKSGKQYDTKTGHHPDFFISEPFDHYSQCSAGYDLCKKLTASVIKDKDRYSYSSEDLPSLQPLYHYTLNQEIRLIQQIRYGSHDKLKELLHELYIQNYTDRTLSDGMQQQFIDAVINSLRRNLKDNFGQDVHQILQLLQPITSFEQLSLYVFNLQNTIQVYLRSKNLVSTDTITLRIIEYIQTHYGNNNLTIHFLCEELSVSESTVNRFFQEMDSSFHTYLENVRMDAACSMLLQKNVTIKQVSEAVGYTSDASFRRAFKRILGISPSAFIESSSQ